MTIVVDKFDGKCNGNKNISIYFSELQFNAKENILYHSHTIVVLKDIKIKLKVRMLMFVLLI